MQLICWLQFVFTSAKQAIALVCRRAIEGLQSERIPRYTLICLGYSGYFLRFRICNSASYHLLFNTKIRKLTTAAIVF